ncbi:MAG TPA: SdrD B-like domain-containing protein, partial [Nitrospirota bacterium]
TSYDPILYDGYYFIEVDFACGLGASDPSLASVYSPVHPDRSAVWTPTSGQPYRGELFYINSLFPGAVLMRIPLAPASNLPLVVDKSVGVSVASMGDLVPFTVNVANPNASSTIYGVNAYDNLPRGLRYKPGSATLGGAPAEPAISPDGRLLSWTIGDMAAGARAEIRFLTYVVPEGGEGKRVNNANASGWQDAALTIPAGSNTADAGFAVNKGIFTDKAYIFGKVFIDENVNAVQDDNEEGVKGVKIYMEDGRYVVTGSEGKYHMDNVDPGSHVLKADETSLPAGTELTVVNNRNLGEPGSAFADVFPGDMFKANFRLARRPRDARAGAGTVGAVVRAGRTIDTIMSDPASGALTLKHGLVIKNNSDGPLYEVVYREASPYIPREGTVYMDGAPYSGVRAKDGAFALSFPLIEPGREVIFEFVSSLPDNNGAASGAITYGARPWGETTRRDVDAPVVFAGKGLDEYSIAVDFGGDGYSLSDDAKVSLDRISDALRKRDYRGITVSVNGHADEAAAADDPDLSYMRSKAVKDYLAGALLDMDRVTIGNEASDATGLDGSGAVARMPSGTPDAATYSDVPPDRGAGITIRPIVKGDSGGEMGPGGSLPAGKYRVTVSAAMLSTLGRLYDAEAFLSLPEGMS